MVSLFSKLDPLASKKRKNKESFAIDNVISSVMEVFSGEILENNIKVEYNIESVSFYGWAQNLYAILTNVIDNSIFWLSNEEGERKIKNSLHGESNKNWIIDVIDSGPGIEKELLQNEVIFEPEFTTKSNGTGLGLAIAGEAATRNEVRLIAIDNENGAHIRLVFEERIDE